MSGSDLFVTFDGPSGGTTIGEYTTAGAVVNAALVSGLNGPEAIAIVPTAAAVPEPSALALFGAGLAGLAVIAFSRRRKIDSHAPFE